MNLDEVLLYYEQHIDSIADIYITNRDAGSLITTAIITYTDDAKMILGVSVIGVFDDPDDVRRNLKVFNEIKLFVDSKVACIVG